MKGFHLSRACVIFLISTLFLIFSPTYATTKKSPLDLWRTYDLEGNPRSIVKFYMVKDELRADVVNVLIKNGKICEKCGGKNKNKPYIGMNIIKGLKQQGDQWIGGVVLDTDSGNTYSCNITISEDGETMDFHAYKGAPLFGRTVKWRRIVINTD